MPWDMEVAALPDLTEIWLTVKESLLIGVLVKLLLRLLL
jgi:hypothetical protein